VREDEKIIREIFEETLNKLKVEFPNIKEERIRLKITGRSEVFREVLFYPQMKFFLMNEQGLREFKKKYVKHIYNEVKLFLKNERNQKHKSF
jgi:hypothetical protein